MSAEASAQPLESRDEAITRLIAARRGDSPPLDPAVFHAKRVALDARCQALGLTEKEACRFFSIRARASNKRDVALLEALLKRGEAEGDPDAIDDKALATLLHAYGPQGSEHVVWLEEVCNSLHKNPELRAPCLNLHTSALAGDAAALDDMDVLLDAILPTAIMFQVHIRQDGAELLKTKYGESTR